MIIIPIKWLFHWEYIHPTFSDKPILCSLKKKLGVTLLWHGHGSSMSFTWAWAWWTVGCGRYNIWYGPKKYSWGESTPTDAYMCIYIYTIWLFNIAMENGPFIDDFPIKTSIYKAFSMAMWNNQMVYIAYINHIEKKTRKSVFHQHLSHIFHGGPKKGGFTIFFALASPRFVDAP